LAAIAPTLALAGGYLLLGGAALLAQQAFNSGQQRPETPKPEC